MRNHHDIIRRPEMGAYILREVHEGRAEGVLVARDESKEAVITTAAGIMAVQGYACRLVRMADEALFAAQPQSYRQEILPPCLPALSPENGEAAAALARRMLGLLLGN